MSSPVYRSHFLQLTLAALLTITTAGCFAPWFRKEKEGAEAIKTRRDSVRARLEAADRPILLREIATDRLLTRSRLENVGLITRLANTGGAVRASQPREKMLASMRREDVADPNTILDASSTAMVVAITDVPPASRKGQRLDVAVNLSTHAEGTDLQSGWLMRTSMMEMSQLGGSVREGFEFAVAEGPVVTRHQITGSDRPEDRVSGIVIGGGRLLKQRELGVGLSTEWAEAVTMAAVLPAINKRFTYFNGTEKIGVATPEKDSFITLTVPPKYTLDPFHFVNVVLNISFNEGAERFEQRMRTLEIQSRDPRTVRQACWELEAIGEQSIPLLVSNLNHPSAEVRFYCAHSLAYLNDKRAIPVLASLCVQEPAFRAMCLNGLKIIDSYESGEALQELLHAADAETRYGALLALRFRDSTDPRVAGQTFPDVGSILEIPSEGPPMVTVSLQEVPEVAIFGPNPILQLPAFHYVNPQIIVQRSGTGAQISRFAAGKDDAIVHTDADLRSVLSGISEVGGSYGDWVAFLRFCSQTGHLMEPLAMNPIPDTGRTYNREKEAALTFEQTLPDPALESVTTDEGEPVESVPGTIWYNPMTWFGSGS